MRYPSVSAIVAAYNYGRFLPRTLDSALAQDYPADRLEIVVVDDGSTDSTAAVLDEYTARYPGRIRAFRQDNAGYVAATNRALAEARGELWALLDADDLWPAEKTLRQVEIFNARAGVGAVYGDLTVIDADDRVLRPSHWQHDHVSPVRGSGALTPLLAGGDVAGASSIMVRASLAERFAPIPDGVPYVDWWMVMQVAAVAELEYLLEPRVGYREHGGNLTLGAEGARLAREKIKQSQTRRQSLIHGAAAALPASVLVPAWKAVERDGIEAVQAAGSAFVELPATSPQDRARAKQVADRARVLDSRGRTEDALRCWLLAAAHDPFDAEARAAVDTLGERLAAGFASGGDALELGRSFAVLADLRDLVSDPHMITRFTGAFEAGDDVKLVIHAPSMTAGEVGDTLERLFAVAGIDPDAEADMVALPDEAGTLDRQAPQRVTDAALASSTPDELATRHASVISLLTAPEPPPAELDCSAVAASH